MRLLHVTDTYSPTVGGIEVLVSSLAHHQRAAGHQVTVLTRASPGVAADPAGSEPAYLDPAFQQAEPRGRTGAGPTVCRDPRRLAELVRWADCVHAHVSAISPLALRGAEVAAQADVPVVATVHSMWGAAWPVVRAVALARRWPDLPIQWAAVSEAAAGAVRAAVTRGPVLVLPNAIDVATWAPQPRLAPLEGITVVAVQRMVRRKRPLRLVSILQRARAGVPDHVRVRVVVVGDGEQLATLRSRVRRAGMESWVRTPGALSHDDLRSLYHDADIFVAPAAAESFGIAALEARASGLVVLAREGTGVGDFVSHGHTGLLAPDDARMADHLALLCRDPLLLDRMRTASRAVRPPFDWSDVLWRNEEAYAVAAGARVRAVPVVTGSQPA